MTTTQHKRLQPAGPTAPTINAVAGGGTFTATAQFYKITALIAGQPESAPSSEVTTTPAASGHIDLTWVCPAGTTAIRIYRGTATNTENVLVIQLQGAPTSFSDTNLNAGAATPPAATSFGATTKGGTPSQPTKAIYAGSRPAGLDELLYAAAVGWQTSVNTGSAQTATRNKKLANACGYDLQEV